MKIRPLQRFASWQAVVFFSIASSLSSCNNDDLVGLGIQPDGQFDGVEFTDTFQINTTSRFADPILSINYQNYLGEIKSTEFGSVQAGIAVDFVLGSVSPPDNFDKYTIDSCVLHLMPTSFYGNYQNGSQVEVYKLASPLDDKDHKGDYQPDVFGNAVTTFSLATDTLNSILIDGDSNNVEPFQYRVDLGLKIGEELKYWFDNQTTGSFNGLYLKTIPNSHQEEGCLYQFSLLTAESRIRLYLTNYDTIPNQTMVVSYPIGSNANRISTYTFDFEDSDAKKSMDSALVTNAKVYVEGLGGMKAQIKIPGLSNFALGRKLAISKAILTLPIDSTQTELFSPTAYAARSSTTSPKLILLDDDPSGESFTLDQLSNASRHNGNYNADSMTYNWDITRTVQKVVDEGLNGNDVNYGFTINFDVPAVNGNQWYQMVLLGSKHATLKVYYTDITD